VKILVIEDDRTVGQYVARGLEEHHYTAELVTEGAAGLAAARAGHWDLIVLDLRLPGMPGLAVLRNLRDGGVGTPVIVLTAQDSIEGKVDALRAGADDYVTKPFAMEELVARVEAISRRPKDLAPPVVQLADLTVDVGRRQVTRGGAPIDLTPKEYEVLVYLVSHPGRVMSRTIITEAVWDYHLDPGTNIVDVVINRLRKKIDQGREPKLIHTVRGVGYVAKVA
jgi:DNA-binding response OmpR family regulator